MRFRNLLPDDCPPENAHGVRLRVFYLVSFPIRPDDFQSLRERQPAKLFDDPVMECQANGVSVFSKVEHLKRAQAASRRLRNKHISIGDLTQVCGVVCPTHSRFGNSHHTWWIAKEIEPMSLFSMIEE